MATQVSVVDCCCWERCSSPAPIAPQGRGHTRGSAGTPVLRSDERDPNVRDLGEQEDGGLGVQQPSESVAERTSGGGQDDGNGHEPAQSGRSKGKSQYSGCTIVHIDRYYQSRREAGSIKLLDVLWL